MVTSHSFYRFPPNMSQSQLIRKQWTTFKIWCDKARFESQTTFVKMVEDARRDKDKLCKTEPKRKDYHESVFDGQKTRLREQIQEGFVALLREEWQLRLRRIGLDEDDLDSDQREEYEEFFNGDPSTIIKPHAGNVPIPDPVSSASSPYDSDMTVYETSPVMNSIDLEKVSFPVSRRPDLTTFLFSQQGRMTTPHRPGIMTTITSLRSSMTFTDSIEKPN
jgi:hypothetical protein